MDRSIHRSILDCSVCRVDAWRILMPEREWNTRSLRWILLWFLFVCFDTVFNIFMIGRYYQSVISTADVTYGTS